MKIFHPPQYTSNTPWCVHTSDSDRVTVVHFADSWRRARPCRRGSQRECNGVKGSRYPAAAAIVPVRAATHYTTGPAAHRFGAGHIDGWMDGWGLVNGWWDALGRMNEEKSIMPPCARRQSCRGTGSLTNPLTWSQSQQLPAAQCNRLPAALAALKGDLWPSVWVCMSKRFKEWGGAAGRNRYGGLFMCLSAHLLPLNENQHHPFLRCGW